MDLNNIKDQNGNPISMEWYKFLIYFMLFASSLINLVLGIGYLTGSIYEIRWGEVSSEYVYSVFDGLQTIDVIYGIAGIGLAVFDIIVRNKLAKFASNALKLLDILFSVTIGVYVLYVIMIITFTDIEIYLSLITPIVITFAWFAFYKSYFSKRAFLFGGNVYVHKPKQGQYVESQAPQVTAQYGENKSQSLTPTAKTMVTPKTTHASENRCVFCMECGNAQEPGTEVCAICGAKIE